MKQLTTAIQESLLALLCHDDRAGLTVRALVPCRTYDPYFRDVAEAAERYWDRYKRPPGEHTLDLVDQLKVKRPDSASIFDRLYRSMEQTRTTVNRDYVVGCAQAFARVQRLKAGITKALDALESEREGYVDEAEAAVASATKHANDLFDPGLLLNDPKQALRFLDRDDDYFPLDIAPLDAVDAGPVRKGLWLFMALPNRGKTWALVSAGKAAFRSRRRVLHVTCEMSQEAMAQRYLQSLFNVTKRNKPVRYRRFVRDELDRLTDISEAILKERPYIKSSRIRGQLHKRIESTLVNRPPLLIKEFPTGGLTVAELKAFLDNLESTRSFIPDLLILDYADLMKVDSKNYRVDLGRVYKELRGIAVERNMAVATATQANREGLSSREVGERHTSEDFSKNHTADTILAYSQTDDEYEMGLARVKVIKSRGDEKNVQVLLSQAYAAGQFFMDAVRMVDPKSYWDMIDAEAGEDGDGGSDGDDDEQEKRR